MVRWPNTTGCHCKRSHVLKNIVSVSSKYFLRPKLQWKLPKFWGKSNAQKLVGTKKAGAIGPRGLQTRTVPLRSVKPGQSMQFLRNALLAQKKAKRSVPSTPSLKTKSKANTTPSTSTTSTTVSKASSGNNSINNLSKRINPSDTSKAASSNMTKKNVRLPAGANGNNALNKKQVKAQCVKLKCPAVTYHLGLPDASTAKKRPTIAGLDYSGKKNQQSIKR